MKNIVVGPLKQDLGVITFALVSCLAPEPTCVLRRRSKGAHLNAAQIIAAELFAPYPALKGAATLVVSLQFGAVAAKVCTAPAAKVRAAANRMTPLGSRSESARARAHAQVAKNLKKTTRWATVFQGYLAVSAVFWGAASVVRFMGKAQ